MVHFNADTLHALIAKANLHDDLCQCLSLAYLTVSHPMQSLDPPQPTHDQWISRDLDVLDGDGNTIHEKPDMQF